MPSHPLIGGVAFIVTSVVFVGATVTDVSVRLGGYSLVGVVSGILAIAFGIWGLCRTIDGKYGVGCGLLSGAGGVTLIFLAPFARSEIMFVATGGLILLISAGFLLATEMGYVFVIDDGRHRETAMETDQE